ncbi:MAG: UDP-N-acetylglucosamine 1-carboxyvinyltransferase [Oscillospiraceae bacterium]|jgi:UDP-N-acetylglucosamine 1-carboxyvinyltransferase|nr:UDP-N-acetylglucosamine 1-carboxyvinyltransferase [Oscillospiraceae bacterium]
MDNSTYIIKGGLSLNGSVAISGAKNAAAAIIPAALMTDGSCRVENIPDISDNAKLFKILRRMGAQITRVGRDAWDIDCSGVKTHVAVFDEMQQIRSSYYLVGALLARFGRADVAMPGGCNFGGPRPIDQHIKGFTALGAKIEINNGVLTATTDGGLHSANVLLDGIPSVGATINIMFAATTADGLTVIENAAREPHIVDAAQFLNLMGADVRGAGTETIKIRGAKKLHGAAHTIIPDQIEAGTFMAAVAATGGEVELTNVIPRHLECISVKLREMGIVVDEFAGEGRVVVKSSGKITPTDVKTLPYPGFPTDMQPQISTVLTLAGGTSRVTDSVWESRFRYVDELTKMGARARISGATATIDGVRKLTGATIKATDLRAGAALVIAGLAAHGTTTVEGVEYVERGYEHFVEKLNSLGADVSRSGYVSDSMSESIAGDAAFGVPSKQA